MSSLSKVCPECGVALQAGVANCSFCGARVGTVFSEDQRIPEVGSALRPKPAEFALRYQRIERAQEHANNSLALALASFFCPGLGFLLGGASIVMAVFAIRALKELEIEEGRGPATAAVAVGSLGLVAQVCYVIYVIKMGVPFTG